MRYALVQDVTELSVPAAGEEVLHAQCGQEMIPTTTGNKYMCLNCHKVGYPMVEYSDA